MGESTFLAELRLYLGKRSDILALRINTGVFKPLHGDQKRAIRSAPNGTADLLCIWTGGVDPPIGRGLAIETKYARGDQFQAQCDFQTAWEKRGGIYIIARRIEHVTKVIGE